MTFALKLKYKEFCSQGSFIAWGIGFNYKYNPDDHILEVSDARKNSPLLHIYLDRHVSRYPVSYIENLEKATQINALMLSNNKTIDLSEILNGSRIIAILENSVRLSRYSFNLEHKKFKHFSYGFCNDFNINLIKIKEIKTRDSKNFYIAKLRTQNSNEIKATSFSIHGIMKNLSKTAINELMDIEYAHYHSQSAYNLLSASSNMESISHILNNGFSPYKKITEYNRKIKANSSH
ncbi:MAG: hypothetical protein KAJ86_04285 [Alphaproteobacteria bacterium]|nr:hypothetical protein [Alphaproteobacteria bacterium]